MENKLKLGQLIQVARTERGITQRELAKRIETVQESISRAEKHGCELEFAEKAVGALGFEITNIALRNRDPFASGLQFYS